MCGRPKPGTLGLLVAEYMASGAFFDLAPRTKADYQRCLDYRKPIADTPLHRFDRAIVVRIRDKAAMQHGRRFANYVKAVLSIVFAWGAERSFLKENPAAKLKNIRRRERPLRQIDLGRTRSAMPCSTWRPHTCV